MSREIELLHAKADDYKTRWPLYHDLIEWLVDLLLETIQAEEKFRIPKTIFENAASAGGLIRGIPLFDGNSLPLDVGESRNLYRVLVAKTAVHQGDRSAALESILSGSEQRIETVLRNLLTGNTSALRSLSEKTGADPQGVEFLLKLALRPGLKRLSRWTTEIDLSSWSFGHCPLCGFPPALSELPADGTDRRLYCSLCEMSWSYSRFLCPICNQDGRINMRYLYAEDERHFRVDYCTYCKKGLKTIMSQHARHDVIPLLDDLISTHLTMAVEENMTDIS